VALIVTSSVAQGGPVHWSRVTDQHGSSVELPLSILTPDRDPLGLRFEAERGAVRIRFQTTTESRPGFPGNDPKGDMDLKRADCTNWPPAYYLLKEQVAAYSCVSGASVRYYVARYTTSGNVALFVEYPKGERETWDRTVARMSASMRQMERKEVR
jgi:hypothetical protein